MVDKKTIKNSYYLFSGNSEGLFDYVHEIGRVCLSDEGTLYVEFAKMSNELLDSFSNEQIKRLPITDMVLYNLGFSPHGVDGFYMFFNEALGISVKLVTEQLFWAGGEVRTPKYFLNNDIRKRVEFVDEVINDINLKFLIKRQ